MSNVTWKNESYSALFSHFWQTINYVKCFKFLRIKVLDEIKLA